MKHCLKCGHATDLDHKYCPSCGHKLDSLKEKEWSKWCFWAILWMLGWVAWNILMNQDYFQSMNIPKTVWLGQGIFVSFIYIIFVMIIFFLVKAANYRSIRIAKTIEIIGFIVLIAFVLNEDWFISSYIDTYEKVTGKNIQNPFTDNLDTEVIETKPSQQITYTHRDYTFTLSDNFKPTKVTQTMQNTKQQSRYSFVYEIGEQNILEYSTETPLTSDDYVFTNQEEDSFIVISQTIVGDVSLDELIVELKKGSQAITPLNEQILTKQGIKFYREDYTLSTLEEDIAIDITGVNRGVMYTIEVTAPKGKAQQIADKLFSSFYVTYQGFLLCPNDLTVFEGHCCPEGTQIYRDGQCFQCPKGMLPIEGNYCCPESYTKVSNKGNCYN